MQDESLNLLFLGGGLSSLGKGIAGGVTSLFTKSAAEDAAIEAAARGASAGASSGIIASGSKAAIRQAIEDGTISDAQAQAVKRALARGKSADTYSIEKLADGSIRVIRTVAGRTGGCATYEVFDLLCKAHDLTPRERQLAALLRSGLATKELGEAMRILPYTVQDHLKAMFDKTGVRSRGELISRLADVRGVAVGG